MYHVINVAKDGTELYVAHHELENGSWRSKHKEDARLFRSEQDAQNFINKMKFKSTFKIVEAN